jgi:hypothetical protein
LFISPLGLCKHRDRFCQHEERSYRHLRDLGYDVVIFGFLDQSDEDLACLEYYGRSEAVPGLIPASFRDKNRVELRRRLDLTGALGLSVCWKAWTGMAMRPSATRRPTVWRPTGSKAGSLAGDAGKLGGQPL